jgi:hypothetical protein
MAYTISADLFEEMAYNVHNEEGELVERIVSTLAGWTYQLRQQRGEYTPHFDSAAEAFNALEETKKSDVTIINKGNDDAQLTLF